jgi:hypothetical protein
VGRGFESLQARHNKITSEAMIIKASEVFFTFYSRFIYIIILLKLLLFIDFYYYFLSYIKKSCVNVVYLQFTFQICIEQNLTADIPKSNQKHNVRKEIRAFKMYFSIKFNL